MPFLKDINEALTKISSLTNRKIIRFFKVAVPVASVPVNMTLKMASDDYHIIEEYMMKIIACGGVQDFNELAYLMGLSNNLSIAKVFYDDLINIEHIRQDEDGLHITDLGKQSIATNKKIFFKDAGRMLYLDASTFIPLPRLFYEHNFVFGSRSKYLSGCYVFDEGRYVFDDSYLDRNIRRMNVKDRSYYNIPMELDSIVFDKDADSIDILYTRFYFALYDDKKSFDIYDTQKTEKLSFYKELIDRNVSMHSRLLDATDVLGYNTNEIKLSKRDTLESLILKNCAYKIDNNGNYLAQVSSSFLDFITSSADIDYRWAINTLICNKYICIESGADDTNFGKLITIGMSEKTLNELIDISMDIFINKNPSIPQERVEKERNSLLSRKRPTNK